MHVKAPPYDEDDWSLIVIRAESGSVFVKCLFKTVRCLSLNVDIEKGAMAERERQLYGLLARDRRVNDAFPRKFLSSLSHCRLNETDRPVFGQYAFAGPSGRILRVGDRVEVIERNSST
jgi:hypothetical protein